MATSPPLHLTEATSCVCIHLHSCIGLQALLALLALVTEGDGPGQQSHQAGQAGAGLTSVLFICCFNLLSSFMSLFSVQGRDSRTTLLPSICLFICLSQAGWVQSWRS